MDGEDKGQRWWCAGEFWSIDGDGGAVLRVQERERDTLERGRRDKDEAGEVDSGVGVSGSSSDRDKRESERLNEGGAV